MKVQVLFFSLLRDVTSAAEAFIEVPDGATVGDLLGLLYQRWPGLQKWDGSLLLAVDQTYVKRDHPLHQAAEVAIMPPVQGG